MSAVLDAVRRPEYTGENRCMPCTAVNLIIASLGAIVVAVSLPLGPVTSGLLSGGLLLAALVVIWLRGYLVPGTPWLTARFLPERVHRYFEHGQAEPAVDVDPLAVLEEAGAVEECADVDDLCLAEGFRAAWYDRMETLRGTDATRAELAAMLDLPEEDVDLETHTDAFVALAPGDGGLGRWRVGQWESEGAFLADMAGARVLDDRVPHWSELDAAARGRVLNGLRVFLDACPSCGGDVTFGEDTVESCCRSKEVVAVSCRECGDRLFEADQPVPT